MRAEGTVEAAIRAVVSERMKDARIVSVRAEHDFDSDGDDVLNVTVVIETASKLDASHLASIVRHVRPKLDEVGESSFPMMSFVTQSDARKLGLEAV
jgi:hypothetical protein